EFKAIPGVEAWQLSNPPIFALAPLLASLRVFDDAGFASLRARSLELTGFLADAIAGELTESVGILTPMENAAHGAQLSLRVRGGRERAHAAFEALAAFGIVADWREPDVIRVAPAPLYNNRC